MTSAQRALDEHSREFYDYIRGIGDSKSKQEEDELVVKDLRALRKSIAKPNRDTITCKEHVIRVLYAEMLGHRAEFAHIHCVNLTSSADLCSKRTGYLVTGLCIDPGSELMYLVVANILRDMKSTNYLEVAAAAEAAARLLRPELMHAVADEVGALLQHPQALVRRKATGALHAFYIKSAGEVADTRLFRQALTDRDPSVMDAAVRLMYDAVRRAPETQRDLLDAFLSILAQVAQRRLPREYDYRNTPAPWLQIRLIRLVVLLVGDDAALAAKCEPLLMELMRRADSGRAIGFAVISEIVAAAAALPPLDNLLEMSARAVEGFLTSQNPNNRYMGVKMLTQVASSYPEIAAEHQEVVMACLEDPDETIRRRTITLLFAICNADNVDAIANRIVRYLSGATMQAAAFDDSGQPITAAAASMEGEAAGGMADAYLKRSVTMGLCVLAERFAPSAAWYVRTMNRILLVAHECVPHTTVQRMLKLIAEGQNGVDEAANAVFRAECVEGYFHLTGGGGISGGGGGPATYVSGGGGAGQVPDILNRVAAWVIGEYGFLSQKISRRMLMDRLCDMLERADAAVAAGGVSSGSTSETRAWIVMALMKLIAQGGDGDGDGDGQTVAYAEELIHKLQDSRDVGVQQRCYEFAALRRRPAHLLRRVLPRDGCCEDMQVQEDLPFLDVIVANARAGGAAEFDPRRMQEVRAAAGRHDGEGGLLPMDAYQRPAAGNEAAAASALAAMMLADGPTDVLGLRQLPGMEAAVPALQTGSTTAYSATRRHGAKRWGLKDLESAPSPPPEDSTNGAGSANAGRDGGDPKQQQQQQLFSTNAGSAGAGHVDPSQAAPAAAGRFTAAARTSRNAKFVQDIFGGSKGRRAGGRTGRTAVLPTEPSATAPDGGAAEQASRQELWQGTAGRSSNIMEDLFRAAPGATDTPTLNVRTHSAQSFTSASPPPAASSGAPASPSSSSLLEGFISPAKGTASQGERKRWGPAAHVPAEAGRPAAPDPSSQTSLWSLGARRSRADGACVLTFTASSPAGSASAAAGGTMSPALVLTCPPGLALLRRDGLDEGHFFAPPAVSPTSTVRVELQQSTGTSTTTTVEVEVCAGDDVGAFASVCSSSSSSAHTPPVVTAVIVGRSGAQNNGSDAFSFLASSAPQQRGGTAEEVLAQKHVAVFVADVLRPAPASVSTATFGELWTQTSGEAKGALSPVPPLLTDLTDAAALRQFLDTAASLRVVEIIETEWIAAARVAAPASSQGAQGAAGTTVLCHIAVSSRGHAALTVRCASEPLRKAVLQALTQPPVRSAN